MAKGKKKDNLSLKEKLEQALIPLDRQLYEIPSNWCWVNFEALSEDMADGPFGSNLKTEHYTKNKEVRIIQLSNIGEEGWREENTKYTTFEHVKTISRSIVEAGNIVIAKMMPAGRAIICPDNEKQYVLSSDAVKMVPCNNLDIKYLLYGINSTMFRNQVLENTQGITRPRTSIKKLKEYSFPLPPFQEQQRIVEQIENLFSKLDEAKEKAQEAVEAFANIQSAILYDAFTGKLTENWRKENCRSLESWKGFTIQEVCSMKITDGTHKTPTYCEKEDDGIPFISSKDVTSKRICWDNIKYIVPKLHEELYNRLAPQVDDVLLAKNGTTGVAAIVEEEKIFDIYVTLAVLRPNKDIINPRYLLNIVNSPICKNQFDEHLTGIGVPNLHLRDIKEVKIKVPEIDEQRVVVDIIDTLLRKEQLALETASKTIEMIDLMKKSILAKAFRGKLGTNDLSESSSIELLKEILQ